MGSEPVSCRSDRPCPCGERQRRRRPSSSRLQPRTDHDAAWRLQQHDEHAGTQHSTMRIVHDLTDTDTTHSLRLSLLADWHRQRRPPRQRLVAPLAPALAALLAEHRQHGRPRPRQPGITGLGYYHLDSLRTCPTPVLLLPVPRVIPGRGTLPVIKVSRLLHHVHSPNP